MNTAGAAAGCFLTDFLLVPAWGLLATQFVAVALNLVAGVGALLLARTGQLPIGKAQGSKLKAQGSRLKTQGAGRKAEVAGRKAEVTAGPSSRDPVVLTSVALALSGCAALGMEILWFRHFSMMLGAFRAVFSLLLTVILVGIGVGSLGAGWMQRRIRRPAQWLIVVQSLFIACTLGGMAAGRLARDRPGRVRCHRGVGVRHACCADRVGMDAGRAVVQLAADAGRGRRPGAAHGRRLSPGECARAAGRGVGRPPRGPALFRQYGRRRRRQPRRRIRVAARAGPSGQCDGAHGGGRAGARASRPGHNHEPTNH